ncbi:MAG: M20/M25/M40 family metallo-hydrolase [Planctomycetota bacterium]|nr:M20/M25/M40 family metallo-hydrolase [Planctomycetota bacterium]
MSTEATPEWGAVAEEAVEELRTLLRFETVNPPGNEGACADYIESRLREAGAEVERFESEGRPNVVARVRGTGGGEPLLLTGHMDVVPVERECWTVDPFAAEIQGEFLYGRGALDMKGMLAMSLWVTCRLAQEVTSGQRVLDRDLIFAAVSDEEAGCRHGSRFLVEEHPESVRAGWMIGEFGGFSMEVQGERVYPIQVAEKGIVRLAIRTTGAPGHGSVPHEDMAVVHLARALDRIAQRPLPWHPTRAVRVFLQGIASTRSGMARWVLPKLASPRWGPLLLRTLIADERLRASFTAMLSNTCSPNLISAGEKINVIPGRAEVRCDGRTVPGQTAADLKRELLERCAGLPIEIEIEEEVPGRENDHECPLFEQMCAEIREADPEGHPVAYLMPGFTDGTYFGRLGMRCYGFSPLQLPADFRFWDGVHGHDERTYLPGYRWGLRVLFRVVAGWCTRGKGTESDA